MLLSLLRDDVFLHFKINHFFNSLDRFLIIKYKKHRYSEEKETKTKKERL